MATAEEVKKEFRKAHEYNLEMYPSKETKRAWYLRQHNRKHIFFRAGDSYIIMNEHWITERNGTITYNDLSSESVEVVSMSDVRNKGGIDKYIDRLNGEKK